MANSLPKKPLDPKAKQFLVDTAKQLAVSMVSSPKQVSKQMDAAVQPAAEDLASKKKGLLGRLWDKAGGVVKSVLPTALSFIPGVGPALAGIASAVTGNDDEWFDEFKAAGATFNELLADTKLSDDDKMRLITPGMLVTQVQVLTDKQSPITTYQDQYLPIILAYVRKKTNNVLVTTEADYWKAFVTGSRLYAIYYTLKKYVELTGDLPTNIPALTSTLPLIDPVNYSALVGIVDSLENYLKITIKLPFAWTEYLRWRFGTMFLSENTGKAGLISYDYYELEAGYNSVFSPQVNPTTISLTIEAMKADLAACSRATADIKLAYDDHQTKFNVEKRHYDAKEFNLRCNLNSDQTRGIPSIGSHPLGVLLYMDSRLDQNAAVQAITLSTDGSDNYAPFHIVGTTVAWYNVAAYNVPYYDTVNSSWKTVATTPGWKTKLISYAEADRTGVIRVTAGQGAYTASYGEDLGYVSAHTESRPTGASAALAMYNTVLATYCLNALQVHNQDYETVIGQSAAGNDRITIKSKLLSYDAAIITPTQVEAIHRIALRNLFRGNYKMKLAPNKDPNIVEPIKELVEVTNEAVEKNL